MQIMSLGVSGLTLSAASLQAVSLILKVVLVAQTAAVLEEFAAHGGGVVVVTIG